MKKKIMFMLLALVFSLSLCASALAYSAEQTGSLEVAVQDDGSVLVNDDGSKGSIELSAGLSKVSGTTNTYHLWADLTAGSVESLRVSVYLYKKTGTTYAYIGGASKSVEGRLASAAKNLTLSSGTYEIRAYGYGDTTNRSLTKLRTI